MKPETRWVPAMLLTPLLGVLCFYAPILVGGDADALASPESVSIISRIFENTKLPATLVLLVLSGFGLRYWVGRGTLTFPLLLIAPFPIATAVDVVMNPSTHNLLPFEIALQLAGAVPPLLGTVAASMLAGRKQKQVA